MKLPAARNKNVVTRELEKEILIYDLITDKAYCLNSTAAIIYQGCGQNLNFDELKKYHQLSDEIIHYALEQLYKADLIEGERINVFKGFSRREVIRKVGISSLAALPVVASLVAPTAANAQSRSCPAGSPNTERRAVRHSDRFFYDHRRMPNAGGRSKCQHFLQ